MFSRFPYVSYLQAFCNLCNFQSKPVVPFDSIIMTPLTKRFAFIFLAVSGLLLLPLIATQLTVEVNWTLMDFVVAGGLLLGTALLLDWTIRKIKPIQYRVVISVALLAGLVLVWAELAVGVFGTPLAGH